MVCEKCGACCKIVRIYQKFEKDELIWWEYHGIEAKKSINLDAHYIDFPIPCKHLKNNLCDIWENRPQVCRDFDCNDPIYVDFKKRIQ